MGRVGAPDGRGRKLRKGAMGDEQRYQCTSWVDDGDLDERRRAELQRVESRRVCRRVPRPGLYEAARARTSEKKRLFSARVCNGAQRNVQVAASQNVSFGVMHRGRVEEGSALGARWPGSACCFSFSLSFSPCARPRLSRTRWLCSSSPRSHPCPAPSPFPSSSPSPIAHRHRHRCVGITCAERRLTDDRRSDQDSLRFQRARRKREVSQVVCGSQRKKQDRNSSQIPPPSPARHRGTH